MKTILLMIENFACYFCQMKLKFNTIPMLRLPWTRINKTYFLLTFKLKIDRIWSDFLCHIFWSKKATLIKSVVLKWWCVDYQIFHDFIWSNSGIDIFKCVSDKVNIVVRYRKYRLQLAACYNNRIPNIFMLAQKWWSVDKIDFGII